ncbi:MAG TPA: hypothetical protein VGB22_09410 [candidate division Zixibacteria bacterium]|jgi:hypothetical protein
MACEVYQQLIDRLDLSDEVECGDLVAHAEQCPHCHEKLQAARRLCESMRRAFHFTPSGGFWEEYLMGLRRMARSGQLPREPSLWQRWRRLMCWPVVGEAPAVIVPLLIIGLMIAGGMWSADRSRTPTHAFPNTLVVYTGAVVPVVEDGRPTFYRRVPQH